MSAAPPVALGPDPHASFLEALVEHHAEAEHLDLDEHLLADLETSRSGDERHLGRVRTDLALDEELRGFGGHVGYDVRPSARGRGRATALLAVTPRAAADQALTEVVLTCAPEDGASRRVVERDGGRTVDTSTAGRLRSTCSTCPAGPARPC